MKSTYVVKGIHPATGKVTQATVLADSPDDARAQASNSGLLNVVVTPAVEAASHAPTPPIIPAPSPHTPAFVLVVDDHADSREMLRHMLRHDGYNALPAASAEEALAALRAARASLIIADYDMPGMNGLELLKALRADAATASIPVIIFTANEDLQPAALAAGADAFVVKGTLDWAVLHREIRRLAGPGELSAAAATFAPAAAPRAHVKDAG